MPITNIGSYPITMQEFVEHWIDVNAALGGAPATDYLLHGGYTLATFTTDRATLAALIISINSDQTVVIAAAQRDAKKEAIRGRMVQFRGAAQNNLAGSIYQRLAPTLPDLTDDESDYLDPFDDMANLWAKINADATVPGFTPPLLLQGGYTVANFATDIAALRAAYTAVGAAEENARLDRAKRDDLMVAAYERMKQYRGGLVVVLPPGDPLLATVPDLSPGPGPVLEPVTLSGFWNTATLMADLSWTESTDANLGHYSLRVSFEVPYNEETEVLVNNVMPPLLTYSTDQGLTVPTNTVLFRVYAVRTTGAEAGSNIHEVHRP